MSVPKFNAIYPYENSEIIMVIRICVLGNLQAFMAIKAIVLGIFYSKVRSEASNTITKVIFELAKIAQIIITIYSNLISQFVIFI